MLHGVLCCVKTGMCFMVHCVTYVSSYCVTWYTVLDIRNILAPWQGTASWWRQERAPTVPSVQIKALHQPPCQHPTAFGQIENGNRINDLKIGRRKFYLSFLLGKSFCGIFASFLFSWIILKSLNPIFFQICCLPQICLNEAMLQLFCNLCFLIPISGLDCMYCRWALDNSI